MYRPGVRDRPMPVPRGGSRPPSAPPIPTLKRKERDFDDNVGDETNINVVVRCRGRSDREVRENSGVVVSTTGVKGNNVELSMGPNAISNKTYRFDKVYSPAADQSIIFEDTVSPILNEMLDGYNCTIFAYGQTGTGKTYTMSGDMSDTLGLLSDAAGIIPRVLYSLFQRLEADGMECSVKCSFIELYNEELRDLLSADDSVKLKIYDDSSKKTHATTIVQGMEESHIKNAAAGIQLLQQGSHRRQVAATKCNDLSSRGHTVFTITTYVKKSTDSADDFICSGKLNLVDLAGSENIQRSGAENKRAVEAGLINKSLLTLGRVINALVDKSAHIPYRESKLTRLLQDSLGGRTKTCIIATVSPAKSNLEETISTLDYAFRAKNIRNKPQVNSTISKKTLLKEFTAEIEKLKGELIATRQRNGVYLSNEQYEEITTESESRRILSEEQKARIETMESSLRNKVQELFNLTNNFKMLKKDSEATRTAFEATKDVLSKTELALRDTQQNLDEETILRKAHAATEDKLRSIGTKLVSTVGESVRDIDGLHAKLRRRSALHHQNEDVWTRSATQIMEVAQSMDDRLNQLQSNHESQLAGLSSKIEEFVAAEVDRALQRRQAAHSASLDLRLQTELIEEHSSGSKDDMNEVLEEIKVLREDVKGKVGEGLQGLSEAAAKISGEIISELGQFHTQLHTSYHSLGTEFKKFFEEVTKELMVQQEESNRLRRDLQEANRKNMKSSLAVSSSLEECLENEREALDKEREELLEQISSLISDSHVKRHQRVSKALIATKSDLVQSTEDFEMADRVYAEGMDQWSTGNGTILEKVNKSRDELKNKMKSDWSAIEARNTAIQSSTKAVHEETVKIVDAQMQGMATQMEALDEFVSRARQQNENSHEYHVSNLKELSSQLETTFSSLEKSFDSQSAQRFNAEAQLQCTSMSGCVLPIKSELQPQLRSLPVHLSIGLAQYSPTGDTPQRKTWTYPTELPSTIASQTPPPELSPRKHETLTKTPSKVRSKSKSPRKQFSPKKVTSEVYIDTPPPALLRNDSAKSLPTTTTSLKEIDTNIPFNSQLVPALSEKEDRHHTISFPIPSVPALSDENGPFLASKCFDTTIEPADNVRAVTEMRIPQPTNKKRNGGKPMATNVSSQFSLSIGPGVGSVGSELDGGKENVAHGIETKIAPATVSRVSTRRMLRSTTMNNSSSSPSERA